MTEKAFVDLEGSLVERTDCHCDNLIEELTGIPQRFV